MQKNAEGLTVQDLGTELMLYDPEKDEVHILNQTAKMVWEGLVAGSTEEEIESQLREQLSIEPGHDLRSDIQSIVNQFKQKGVLKGS